LYFITPLVKIEEIIPEENPNGKNTTVVF